MDNAIELAPASPDLLEHGLQLAWIFDIERRHDFSTKRLPKRLHVRARLVVEPGDGDVRTRGTKGGSAAVGDRLIVSDSDDQRLVARQDRPDGLPHWGV